jgi:ligand-binding SRPBCC domain-containing protein
MGQITLSTEVAAPIGDVFAFHLDPRNASRIAPRGQRVLSVEAPETVQRGDEIRLAVRQLPWPFAQHWRVRIEAVDESGAVVDVALAGPFPTWRHEHLFTYAGEGRTLLTDRVTYQLPYGALGRLADRLLVRRMLLRAFRERHERTRAILG